jgi:hypothetical protein
LFIAETTNAMKKVLEPLPLTGTPRCASRGLLATLGAYGLLACNDEMSTRMALSPM